MFKEYCGRKIDLAMKNFHKTLQLSFSIEKESINKLSYIWDDYSFIMLPFIIITFDSVYNFEYILVWEIIIQPEVPVLSKEYAPMKD